MRRLVLFVALLTVLTACGGKKSRVSVPGSSRPSSTPTATELVGLASYYAEPYHGRRTANGEIFDTYNGMTAAHRTLAFNTVVLVKNQTNGQEVEVRINDRGPFIDGRVIDLSLVAARKIDMERAGVVPVELKILQVGDGRRVSATAPPLPSGTAPVFAVQVGAFENAASAESLRDELRKRYSDVSIQTTETDKTLYRVRVGRESNEDAAEKLAAQLRKDSLPTLIVRLN